MVNSSVTNASVELEGYKLYRLDRVGKIGAGVCAYIKITLKAEILNDLTEISVSGLHQLWLQVQSKKRRSFLVCIVYRPPDIGLNCPESDLMPKYTQALSLNRDIVLTGEVNCDLLTKNPRGDALCSFCISVNAKQLIEKPTRVTKNCRSLLDVIMVSNPDLVQSSDVLDLTISDHYLAFAVLNLRAPKQDTNYITTRSFRKYNTDQIANDIAHIPWDTTDLMDSADEKLDAFNDLFLTCLNAHAPVKTVKLKHKPNPFITDDIKDLMKTRDSMHRKARKTGAVNDWQAFRDLKKEVKSILRKAEIEHFNEQICANKNNTGAIWKTIRKALHEKSSCTTHYTKDPSILANEFNQFFLFVRL